MYDYHMHSTVSFDARDTALDMALAAKERGLKEICFTDHIDYTPEMNMVFDTAVYNAAYDNLEVPGPVEFSFRYFQDFETKSLLIRKSSSVSLGNISPLSSSILYQRSDSVFFSPSSLYINE